ncbi:phytanoyl-CoA dioxygenase family protein [Micromonospora sp. NPDC007271]|uniref:phytanoyl-CoA dioxygenase family protein n=1 Tax=Micromonospora sp. NPDC007271 TaxID=3154587 RepID=UPI0033FA9A8F
MTSASFTLTEEERDLLPSEEDVRSYVENGWYLSKKLLTDDEVDTLVAASERFYAGHRDRRLPGRPEKLAYWEPGDGDVQRHNDYIHYESDEIAAILRKPIIGAVAARLAETAEVRIFQSTLIYKPPIAAEPSNIVPWHFDRHYWQSCTSERMLTAFIPMHDCTEELGTITMVTGSHTWKEIGGGDNTTRHFAEREKSELEELLRENAAYNQAEIQKVPMLIPKGHMSFHHCRIYHGSGPNRGDRPRRAISLHLQDGENRYRSFHRSDGSLVVYNHDGLVRRDAAGLPDYADPEFCPVLWR